MDMKVIEEKIKKTFGGRLQKRKPIVVRNPKVHAQGMAMTEKWEREQWPSRVNKPEPTPERISTIKKNLGVTRGIARMVKNGEITARPCWQSDTVLDVVYKRPQG